jgi:hypothetical protein
MTVPPFPGREAWPPEPDLASLGLLAEVIQLVLCVQTATTPDGVRAALRTMSARHRAQPARRPRDRRPPAGAGPAGTEIGWSTAPVRRPLRLWDAEPAPSPTVTAV